MTINTLFLRVTDKCNLNCSYCYLFDKKNEEISETTIQNFISLEKYILNYNAGDILNIRLTGGEIFVLPLKQIEKLFKDIYLSNTKITINTNGTLLTKRHIDLLKKYNAEISISLDGTPNIHNIRRSNSYKDVERAAMLMNQQNYGYGIITVINEDSAKHIDEIYEFFKANIMNTRFQCDIPNIAPKSWANAITHIADRMFEDNFIITEREILEVIQYFQSIRKHGKNYHPIHRCYEQFITVNYDGNVTTCNRFCGLNNFNDFIIGNINKDTPTDILFSSKRANLMNQLYNRKEKCFDCEYYKHCKGGCSHICLLYNGNMIERDPFCEANKQIYEHIKHKLEERNYNIPNFIK